MVSDNLVDIRYHDPRLIAAILNHQTCDVVLFAK